MIDLDDLDNRINSRTATGVQPTPQQPSSDVLSRLRMAPTAQPEEDKSGFFRALGAGAIQQLGNLAAIGTTGQDSLGRAGTVAAQQASSDLFQGPSFADVKESPSLAGKYVKGVLGQNVVPMGTYLGAALGGARLGAALGSYGALAGGVLAPAGLFYGSNVARQTQEQEAAKARGETPQEYDLGAAALTAPVQSAIGRFGLGGALRGTTLGAALGGRATGTALADAQRLAGQGFLRTAAGGIGRAAAYEAPTEVAQQALERGQAGLETLSPEALREYEEAAAAGFVAGAPLGTYGKFGERSQARGVVGAEATRVAREEQAEAAHQAELSRVEAARQAQQAQVESVPVGGQYDIPGLEPVSSKAVPSPTSNEAYAEWVQKNGTPETKLSFELTQVPVSSYPLIMEKFKLPSQLTRSVALLQQSGDLQGVVDKLTEVYTSQKTSAPVARKIQRVLVAYHRAIRPKEPEQADLFASAGPQTDVTPTPPEVPQAPLGLPYRPETLQVTPEGVAGTQYQLDERTRQAKVAWDAMTPSQRAEALGYVNQPADAVQPSDVPATPEQPAAVAQPEPSPYIQQLTKARDALLSKGGKPPPGGSTKRESYDRLDALIKELNAPDVPVESPTDVLNQLTEEQESLLTKGGTLPPNGSAKRKLYDSLGERIVALRNQLPGGADAKKSVAVDVQSGLNFNERAASIRQELTKSFGQVGNRVNVVSADADPVAQADPNVQAYVQNGVVTFIADRIAPGTERGVAMHEIGVHLGADKLFRNNTLNSFTAQINDWRSQPGESPQKGFAEAATRRAMSDGVVDNEELVAYFVEEAINAGVNPRVMSESIVQRFLGKIRTTFVSALQRAGLTSWVKLSPQDVVDLAHGAAGNALDPHITVRTSPEVMKSQLSTAGKVANKVAANVRRAVAEQPMAEGLADVGERLLMSSMFTSDFVNYAKEKIPAVSNYLKLLVTKIKFRNDRENNLRSLVDKFQAFDDQTKQDVNNYFNQSTIAGKWGFDPGIPGAVVAPEMVAVYDAINTRNKDAGQFIRDTFKYGRDEQIALRDAYKSAELRGYDAMIADATEAGDAALIASLKAQRKKAETSFPSKFELPPMPYMPLKRFGDYFVVGKSAEFVAKQQAARAGDTVAADWIREHETDESHYFMDMAEGPFEAASYRNQLKAANPEMEWNSFTSTDESRLTNEIPLQTAKRLYEMARVATQNATTDKSEKRQVAQLVAQFYMMTLNQRSALKSQINRRNIPGASKDMMRAFVSQGVSNANLISTLQISDATAESISAMRQQARGDAQGMRMLNEILNRHAAITSFTPTPIQNKLMTTSSFVTLLTNPSYFMLNMMQTPMVSLPAIAGKFGSKAPEYLGGAYADIMQAFDDIVWTGSREANTEALQDRTGAKFDAMRGGEHAMLSDMQDEQKLNIGLESELGDLTNKPRSKAGQHWHSAMQKLRFVVHKGELVNRISAALTTYRLSVENNPLPKIPENRAAIHEQAVNDTRKIIDDTHGDYSMTNAPLLFQQFGKHVPVRLMAQFRKYQLIQLAFTVKTLKAALASMDSSERREARRVALYILGTHLAAAGTMGAPIVTTAGWLLSSVFGEKWEDEEATQRRWLAEAGVNEDIAKLVLKGIPASLGYDISKRVGAANMLSPIPNARDGNTYEEDLTNKMVSLFGGAAGGVALNVAGGLEKMTQGEYWKGTEQMMPSIFKNTMQAIRRSSEGEVSKKGETLISPEELSSLDFVMQVAGIRPDAVVDRQWRAALLARANERFKRDAARLKREYVEAVRTNDVDAKAEVVSKWKQHAQQVKEAGFTPPPLMSLYKAPTEVAKRERELVSGVVSTNKNREFLRRLEEL